jgi:hypothetical protein
MSSLFFFELGRLFFFLMLVIPATYQWERGIILALLLVVIIRNGIHFNWGVHRSIILVLFICIFNSFFFIAYGLSVDAPGALPVVTVFIIWPIVYVLFAGSLRKFERLVQLIQVLVIGIIVACFLGFILVADGFGLLPSVIKQFLELQGGSIGIYEGKIEYSLLNTSTVLYGFPFLFGLLALPKGTSGVNRSLQKLALLAFVLCCVSIVITGRRSLIIVALLTPLFSVLLFKLGGLAIPMRLGTTLIVMFFMFILALVLFYFLDLNWLTILDDFIIAFDFSDDSDRRSSSVRGEQFIALVDGWIRQPLMGYGHGSGVSSVIRDPDAPWSYELSYVALLYQVGVVGFSVYALSLIWLFSRCLQIVRRHPIEAGLLLPMLIGLTGFLIANATNPYLLKFDYLWTIFLPVCFLNSLLVKYQNFNLPINETR